MPRNNKSQIETELQLTLMLGTEEKTLHVIDRRSGESVMRVQLDHETFSRLVGGQIVRVTGKVFPSEHFGQYAHFSETYITTSPDTFETDLELLQKAAHPDITVIKEGWNPHKMRDSQHRVTLLKWSDEPPEEG